MPQSPMTYALSHITQNIPAELLHLAFKPTQYNTTVEQRIISEIVEGPVLLEANLVGGKRREIFVSPQWRLPLEQEATWGQMAQGVQGAYYKIPSEAREGHNIASVVGLTSSLGSSALGVGVASNGAGGFGNTVGALLSEMLNTRTLAQYPQTPRATLEGTNIICLYPELMHNETAVTVFLEYDSEFLNLEPSGIMALAEFCLVATKRYIGNKLQITIDESEIVAGMEIGVIKQLVEKYVQDAETYHDKLMKLKGAMHYDRKSIPRLIYHML